jgi:hypothetical protein
VYAESVRSSWQEWIIRLALVAVACGGAWELWGDLLVDAVAPPAVETAKEPATSPSL